MAEEASPFRWAPAWSVAVGVAGRVSLHPIMDESKKLSRRKFVRRAALGGLALGGGGVAYALLRGRPGPVYPEGLVDTVAPLPDFEGPPPNIVLINADDLGYGDLSCYGSQAIRTPNVDRLAEEGVRFTDFHACDAVCTPSRAGLLTGRYPARMGLDTPLQALGEPLKKRALVRLGYLLGRVGLLDLAASGGGKGLEAAEITLPEALKAGGYRTGMVGKWHLGDYSRDPAYNPIRHGFDFQFGVPYSNDMEPFPLFRNEEMLEADVEDQGTLTGRYTEEALGFMDSVGDDPFFLYFAHTFPHRPLHASEAFAGTSEAGLYGEVVQEVDWSVGEILSYLDRRGLAENTVVVFTSDNGPWYQGSPGAMRGRKGQAFEGGQRVPFIVRAPGWAPAGTVSEVPAMNIDLFPTFLAAGGVGLPRDRVVDGADLTAVWRGETEAPPHEYLYFYHQGALEGVRWGDWKYFRSTSHYTWPMPQNKQLGFLTNHTTGPTPLLFNLRTDPGEAYNLAEREPEVVARLEGAMAAWEVEMAANPLGLLP